MIKLVKLISPAEIAENLKKKKLTKEAVIAKRTQKTNDDDDDIIAGDEIVNLLDPYSRCKISIPVRTLKCKHTQCYDLATFLQINSSARKALECPICFKKMTFNDLIIDGFFEDILQNTASDVESVQITSDGKWSLVKAAEVIVESHGSHSRPSDDIIVLSDSPQSILLVFLIDILL